VLPPLYLHGLSSGDFVPAFGQFLGSAAGLSASVISKLTEQWKTEQRAFAQRDLSQVDYVYLWADGIHVNIRLEEHRLCLLVMIGIRADGRKELIALADGYRESTESWADLLRDWPYMISRPSTGSTCGPPIPSSRPSPRSGTAPRSRRGPGHGPPAWPWPSN
jgi:transposase-like protein